MQTENLDLNKEGAIKAVFEIEVAGKKTHLEVLKERIVIGSVESADIKLSGNEIAPIHAFLEIQFASHPDQCRARVIDLASPSGVKLNGSKVLNEEVKSGGILQVGEALIRFSFARPVKRVNLNDAALLLIDKSTVTPIFDYRPPTKEALEVVYSWNGVILDVKHFVSESSVDLKGNQSGDFLIPPVLSGGSDFKLATKSGASWTLFLDPKMKGVLYLNGVLASVEEVRNSGRGSVTLGPNDFAKAQVGLISFYLSQTVAPPVLRKQVSLIADPFLGKTMMISMAVTGMLLFGVSQMDVVPTEPEPVPETVATILYHPEKYSVKRPKPPEEKREVQKQAPEPDKAKKAEIDFTKPKEKDGKVAQTKSPQPGKKQSAQSQSKEGQGARAQGQEGSRGAKNASLSSTKQTAANRPSPVAGQGRGGTESQVADNGNVQLLKGATNKILDLLGGSGQKLGNSGSKLSGFGGFSTQGNGGAALQGQGKGGGGNADTLLGGTSDRGRGGGRVGTGLGAEGTGAGIVGGKTRIDLNVGGGEETVVVGSIDRDAIDAAIRAHRDEFRYCYERELNSGNTGLAGKILAAFVIGGSGKASQMAVASSSMGSPNVERCVLSVISRIQFPLPSGGVPVTIKYPFAYNNASK